MATAHDFVILGLGTRPSPAIRRARPPWWHVAQGSTSSTSGQTGKGPTFSRSGRSSRAPRRSRGCSRTGAGWYGFADLRVARPASIHRVCATAEVIPHNDATLLFRLVALVAVVGQRVSHRHRALRRERRPGPRRAVPAPLQRRLPSDNLGPQAVCGIDSKNCQRVYLRP